MHLIDWPHLHILTTTMPRPLVAMAVLPLCKLLALSVVGAKYVLYLLEADIILPFVSITGSVPPDCCCALGAVLGDAAAVEEHAVAVE